MYTIDIGDSIWHHFNAIAKDRGSTVKELCEDVLAYEAYMEEHYPGVLYPSPSNQETYNDHSPNGQSI